MTDQPAESSSYGAVLRRPQKGQLAALNDEPSKARTPNAPFPSLVGTLWAPAPSHCGPEMGLEQSVDRSLYVFPFLFLAKSLLLRHAFFS